MKIKRSLRRKLIQVAAFGFSNAHIGNFAQGRLYTGPWKAFCNPGLNCYSCPAASAACPIGALQAVGGSRRFGFSFYAMGLVLAFGVLFGRLICGFLCPFGLIQELLHKLPSPKFRLPKWTTYIKYGILLVFVLLMPALVTELGAGAPAFCKYICPSGTLLGGIPMLLANEEMRSLPGALFALKAAILAAVVIGSVLVYRFFCKLACPLGALYGLLNKISIYHLEVDEGKCVHCHTCARACRMDVDPVAHPRSAECIRCGACREVCPAGAIHLGLGPAKKDAAGNAPSKGS